MPSKINPVECPYFQQSHNLCRHDPVKPQPCPIYAGRGDEMCPRSHAFLQDKKEQEADDGER